MADQDQGCLQQFQGPGWEDFRMVVRGVQALRLCSVARDKDIVE